MPVTRVLSEAGLQNLKVVAEQQNPDPNFSTVKVPNPEEADTLSMGIALAKVSGADLVMGTDPDCDRQR
jgi:phosphoglucomutase